MNLAQTNKSKLQKERHLKEICRIDAIKNEWEIRWQNMKARMVVGEKVDYVEIAGYMKMLNDFDDKLIRIRYQMDYLSQMPSQENLIKESSHE